jgi:HEPN domain-containing protein
MSRWQRGEAEIERMLAGGEIQALSVAAADGKQWLSKASRTLSTATSAADTDPDSAFTLAYDAARFACTALLAQQGLRPTTRGGHYAVEIAVRSQFGATFDRYGGLRRQRNSVEYPVVSTAPLMPSDARSAIEVATELIEAAEQLLPHLGLFKGAASRLRESSGSDA